MKVQSKCAECGNWSESNGSLEDRCTHCNELLNKSQYIARQKAIVNQTIEKENSVFLIKKTDSSIIIFFKRIGLFFQIIFISITAFIIWLVTLLAG